MVDAASEKRTADSKSITKKEDGAKAEVSLNLVVNINIGRQVVDLEEKGAQGDYEQSALGAAEKRVVDSKPITEKDGAVAEAEIEKKETQGDYEQSPSARGAEEKRVVDSKPITEKDGAVAEAKIEEKEAQGDYKQFTRDAAEKPVADSKSIPEKVQKEGGKAEVKKYGKPVTWCERSQRWRDSRGRFCREPSPARR